jgi:hypothetical protein
MALDVLSCPGMLSYSSFYLPISIGLCFAYWSSPLRLQQQQQWTLNDHSVLEGIMCPTKGTDSTRRWLLEEWR